MENPQAQMPQGQPGQAPQEGGQDQMMQQVMQFVQQSIQQGAQPVDIAIQLIQQQVQPEMVMQVFVQMGMPEDQAQEAVETAMEGGQQQQGAGEETLEGDASNPDEEMAEEGAMPVDQPGVMPPEMRFGGSPRRALRRYADGAAVDPNQELESVMQQVQQMMDGGADAREVMQQIQAATQQGKISPEVATSVMEQLSGQMQAVDPQQATGGTNPQAVDPNMASPDSQMMKFGGNLKKLMTKAYGGQAIPPSIDSKSYAKDRANMFVNYVKNNAFKSTLDNEFPSLTGNQMMYGGDLPKADFGADIKNAKTKDEAELAAYRYRQGLSPEEQAKFNIDETIKGWKAPEPTYEAGKNYQYDAATKTWKAAETPAATTTGQGAQAVGYQNPMNGGLYNNLYYGASPMSRFMANSFNSNGMPQITGSNLPGGLTGAQFLAQASGNLIPGMAGTVGDQSWKVTGAEKFKEGSIWKGNRRKGVRYNIDWTNPAAVAAAQAQGQLPPGPQNQPAPGVNPNSGSASRMTPTGGSGMGAMEQLDELGLPVQPVGPANQPPPAVSTAPVQPTVGGPGNTGGSGLGAMEQMQEIGASAPQPAAAPAPVIPAPAAPQNAPMGGGSGMGMMYEDMDQFPSLATQPSAANVADQNLVAPASTDVINPATDVNAVDQNQTQQVPFGMESGIPFNPDYQQAEEYQFQAMTPEQIAARDAQYAPAPAAPVATPPAAVAPPVRSRRGVVTKPVVTNTAPVTPAAPTQSKGTNPWDQDKSSNWYVPKNDEDGFVEFKKTNPKIPNPNAPRWGKGGTEEQLKAAHLQAIKNAQTRMATFNSQQQKQQQFNRNSNANLNSYSNGGGVNPFELNNAIALINRAFGGMIPRADNGMDLGSQDVDANKIPDYLQADNLPKQSTVDITSQQKFNPDWNAVSDMYMNTGSRVMNFMNGVNAMNPERNIARKSALNRQPMEFSQMNQGLYDQAGNFIPNDIGNQVLNPTNTYYSQEKPVFAYGGRVYEIGGDVELDDNELMQLQQAGFKISKI